MQNIDMDFIGFDPDKYDITFMEHSHIEKKKMSAGQAKAQKQLRAKVNKKENKEMMEKINIRNKVDAFLKYINLPLDTKKLNQLSQIQKVHDIGYHIKKEDFEQKEKKE